MNTPTSTALNDISTKLDNLTNTLATPSTYPSQQTSAFVQTPFNIPRTPSWAEVTKAKPPPSISTRYFDPTASTNLTKLQQRIIRGSRIVKIDYLKTDETAPSDLSPSGLANIRDSINKALAEIDTIENMNGTEPTDPPTPRTF
ncbi:hypothetical protein C0991_001113, partial [Blastosporella zonata]